MNKIEVKKRDVLVDYTIDKMSVADMSVKYGLTFKETKSVLRAYGITVRKNEAEPAPKAKEYVVFLTDLNKTLEQLEAETKTKDVVTTA